jgi:hypothetical protein
MKSFDQKEVIIAVLKKFLNEEIDKDLISVKDTVLFVRVSGAKKQVLQLKEKEIRHLLTGAGISITEIR